MLKKTITYTDYNGENKTEDFYFNLSKAELVELETSTDEGLSETLKRIISSNSGNQIIGEFKRIILMAYGQKTADGKFRKSAEISDDFASSGAYSELFMELATDDGAAAAFINGLVPQGMPLPPTQNVELPENSAPAVVEEVPVSSSAAPPATSVPAWVLENRDPTDEEMASMSQEQLVEVLRKRQ